MGIENNEGRLPELKLDYTKLSDEGGMNVVPAVILEEKTNRLLMVGFMNQAAYEKSREIGLATFWSRGRQRLWTKGEESGNSLIVQRWSSDCDDDTIAVWVKRLGPVCHKGPVSCFDPVESDNLKENL